MSQSRVRRGVAFLLVTSSLSTPALAAKTKPAKAEAAAPAPSEPPKVVAPMAPVPDNPDTPPDFGSGAAGAPAAAPPAAPGSLGSAGQILITSDLQVGLGYTHITKSFQVGVAPAADYFLQPNLSVGGQVRLGYYTNDDGSGYSAGVGPRVGYLLPLADKLSLYARGGVFWQHTSTKGSIAGVPSDASANLFTAFVFAPVLFQPAGDFFVGFGPQVLVDVAGGDPDSRTFQVGLSSTLGGTFGP